MREQRANSQYATTNPAIFAAPKGFLQRQCACGEHTAGGGECDDCRKKDTLVQRHAVATAGPERIPRIVRDVIASQGHSLSGDVRAIMEPRFGQDFSRVRLHTDSRAAESAGSVNAHAYTVGEHIAFQSGRYDPSSVSGQRLLAHELTHVVQNRNAGVSNSGSLHPISRPSDASEQEASRVAGNASGGDSFKVNGPATGLMHRDAGTAIGVGAGIAGGIGAGLGIAYLAGAFDSKEKKQAKKLTKELQPLIDGATWKEIRKHAYPHESAAGVGRAKERKAGRLPDLTGLGRIATLEHFASAVRGIQGRWNVSPDDRVRMLGNAANAELTAADVPAFLLVDKASMEWKGFFTSSLWKFTISEDLVTGGTLNDKDAAEVANTTLHESRHAEQNFLAARYAAGIEHKDSPTIASEHNIPDVIADKAVAKKFDAGTDAAIVGMGRRMNQAMVVEGASNQAISDDDGVAEMAVKRTEAQAALQTLKSNATAQTIANATAKRDALRAQITVVEQKYGLYRNIPYEADAHEVGDAAEQAFKGWPR